MFRLAWVALHTATDLAPSCRAHCFPTDARITARAGRGLSISSRVPLRFAAAARGFTTATGSDL